MLQSLPSTIRLKLDQTLAQWPQWNCDPVVTRAPTIVKVLTSGISNYSVLVESEQHFVVRIDGFKPAKFGLCRQTEWRALQAAYKVGLTPRPCYFNPDLGSLVCDYLAPDVAQGLVVSDVARLLHKIHRLPPRHHRLNLADRNSRYEKQLKRQGRSPNSVFRQYGVTISRLLKEIARHPGETVLCHNDLLRANRIYSAGKLWAIDWEYCAMASPWYDIAVIVNGDALPAHETEALLLAYLGRAPNDWERVTLQRYGCVYRYLELLYYKTLEKPILDALAIEKKSAALESMLEQAAD
ncbi:MAG: phosphotransferase [Halioglobus sp.]|nr:phosphotransferase [Halioglobus sp.]